MISNDAEFLDRVNETLQKWGSRHNFRFTILPTSAPTLLQFTIRCDRCGQGIPFSVHPGVYRGRSEPDPIPIVKDIVRRIWIGLDDCDDYILGRVMKS